MAVMDNEVLLSVFSAVFEGFAFMFVEADTDVAAENPGDCLRAGISFESDAYQGTLEVIAPVSLCDELAENILGADGGDLPAEAGASALEEVVNVACGSLLAEAFGTDSVFELSIPKAKPVETEWAEMAGGQGYSTFLVEEEPLLVSVHVNRK